jgi:formylglycine-generating enzyme required for sulfatase activity
MKSCPTCNRTFEDTMSFCLVDGAILSAPFDPLSKEDEFTKPHAEPPATQRFSTQASRGAPEADLPPATVAAKMTARSNIRPTISDAAAEPGPTPAQQSPVETIIAPLPEVAFGKQMPSSAVPALYEDDSRASGSLWKYSLLSAIALLALILVGGAFWLIKRTRNQPKRSTVQAASSSKSAAAISGATFTEKAGGVDIDMISIDGGSLLMGSPLAEPGRDKDEGPQTTVNVQKFYMSKYEITQAQYRAVMGSNPATFKGDDLPVDSVSWNDAVEYCRKLSATTGHHYRLPTEAEWEYAARAGTSGPSTTNVDAVGWCGGNSGHRSHAVGLKQANGFGLYDMYGNLWEWCQTQYKPYPYSADDGRESLVNDAVHVLRGGSWGSDDRACRAAYRRRVVPDPRSTGFRTVLIP